jgi:hypothetical protein
VIWTIVSLIALPFAVWRVSSVLVNEAGPFDMMTKLRNFVGIRYNEYSEMYTTNTSADLFTCVWCMSVWVSVLLVALLFLQEQISAFVNLVFAASAIAIMIDEIMENDNG